MRRCCSSWAVQACWLARTQPCYSGMRQQLSLVALPSCALQAMEQVEKVWPSEANMVLLRVPDAARTQAAMKARGVLVKNVSALHPLLANCLRLTVGSAEENTPMLAVLQESL